MIRLAVRAQSATAERVLGALLELAPSGVEQVDGRGFVEYAVYGAPGELPSLPEGVARVGGVEVVVRGEPVPDDWAERWRRFTAPCWWEDAFTSGRRGSAPPSSQARPRW